MVPPRTIHPLPADGIRPGCRTRDCRNTATYLIRPAGSSAIADITYLCDRCAKTLIPGKPLPARPPGRSIKPLHRRKSR